MQIIHYDPVDNPNLINLKPEKSVLHYKTVGAYRGCGSKWKRHHHVKYERRVVASCSSGDSVPHTWGY